LLATSEPPIRLHDPRHGTATLAHAAGADLKDIQHMLGHTVTAVTAVNDPAPEDR
jgi:site-specific recombinase XerD